MLITIHEKSCRGEGRITIARRSMPSRSASSGTPPQWGVAAGEGRRPTTGRRSGSPWSASRFPMTGSLKLKIGHIVLVLSGWRYCGLMSLEQSDPSKIGAKILGVKGIVMARSMSPASARHGIRSPKEEGFKLDNKLHWMKAFPF